MKNATRLLRARSLPQEQSGTQVSLTPRRAGWELVGFSVRQIARGDTWGGRTGGHEVCLVLLSGLASVTWSPDQRRAATLRGSWPPPDPRVPLIQRPLPQ